MGPEVSDGRENPETPRDEAKPAPTAVNYDTWKREAVNTARVLHGEQPQENLTVFQSIEQAKQWLNKL